MIIKKPNLVKYYETEKTIFTPNMNYTNTIICAYVTMMLKTVNNK